MLSNKKTASIDGYKLGRKLSEGASAIVMLGTSEDGTEYAMKIFPKNNSKYNYSKAVNNLEEEIKIVKSFDHKHVVKYFDFKIDSTMIGKDGK